MQAARSRRARATRHRAGGTGSPRRRAPCARRECSGGICGSGRSRGYARRCGPVRRAPERGGASARTSSRSASATISLLGSRTQMREAGSAAWWLQRCARCAWFVARRPDASAHKRKNAESAFANSAFPSFVARGRNAGCIPRYHWGLSGGWWRDVPSSSLFSVAGQGTDRLGLQRSKIDVFAFAAAKSLRMSSASSLTTSACFRIDSSATDASTMSRVRVLPSRAPAAWAATSSNAITSQPRSSASSVPASESDWPERPRAPVPAAPGPLRAEPGVRPKPGAWNGRPRSRRPRHRQRTSSRGALPPRWTLLDAGASR